MGIDIFTEWEGQTKTEIKKQSENLLNGDAGRYGYLREAYHGEPYATQVLLPELWEEGVHPLEGVPIPAARLRERLGPTLSAAMLRQSKVYNQPQDCDATRTICQSFKDFVDLCATKEAETGKPCLIRAWY